MDNGKSVGAGASALTEFLEAKRRLAALLVRICELPATQATIFGGSGDESLTVHTFLSDLSHQIGKDAFRVAVIGEYSTGKSSLLNALLGLYDPDGKKTDGFLPTAIVPTTAVITTLYHRPELAVEILLKDGTRKTADLGEIKAYLSQPGLWSRFRFLGDREQKERMAENMAEVRVGYDAELLAHGVEILDTPGLGSVYEEHGRITRRCVAGVDAVIFTLSTDPPMGEQERTFLQYVAGFTDRFLFVQNKRDVGELQGLWRDRERQHRRCIEEVLQHQNYPFFHVSALQTANALRRGDPELSAASGIPALRESLERFLVEIRGAPRIERWTRQVRGALDLVRLRLENQRAVLDAGMREVDFEVPSDGDYRQWEILRGVLQEDLSRLSGEAKKQLEGMIPAIQRAVRVDAQQALAGRDAGSLSRDQNGLHQIERNIVSSTQRHVRREMEHEVDRVRQQTVKAISQSLEGKMPEILRRYQPGQSADPFLRSLDLHLDASRLFHRTEGAPQAKGFWGSVCLFVRCLFGGGNPQPSEQYTMSADYFMTTVDKGVQDAVIEVCHHLNGELDQWKKAALGELDRIIATACQVAEQHRLARDKARHDCESGLKAVEGELSELEVLAREFDLWSAGYTAANETAAAA